MQSHASWSISLWPWGRVHVRVHMLFILFAACTLYLSGFNQLTERAPMRVWIVPAGLLILLVSVLLHELGHYWSAIRVGGDGGDIVIWPLGGLTAMRVPHEPSAEFVVHLAGPLVNLLICFICGLAVLVAEGPSLLAGLLHPLAPKNLVEGASWLAAVRLCFWINWVLLAVNLLPAFPFDGGRALRAALLAWRPQAAPRHAAFIVASLAKVAAIALLVTAWFLRHSRINPVVPLWFSLVLLAIFLYFSAKHEEERSQESDGDHELFGYDFSQGYTSLDRSTDQQEQAGPVVRWLERRRRARVQRKRELEAEEERRVDEILARLHSAGIESLSADDRSLLKRVSARYRQRNSGQR